VAKLTLSFKDRKLKVFALEPGESVIGRDPDCTIVIDSLAVAPRHARIHLEGECWMVEPLSGEHELTIGDQVVTDSFTLGNGDVISIGKHNLAFSTESQGAPQTPVTALPTVGWLQIQNGSHMGRTIRLNKAFTRVGRPEGELAVIAHRDDGYYLSALHGEHGPQLNGESIGECRRKLQDKDDIVIGELRLQFFADGHTAHASGLAPAAQRRFSRVPLDVEVTLNDGQQSLQSQLLDISLHGALIKAPAAFEARPNARYRLAVHLEGGPDICMDVEVAHREDDALGLECRDIDVESISHLRRLVELNLGDPELLERELSALG